MQLTITRKNRTIMKTPFVLFILLTLFCSCENTTEQNRTIENEEWIIEAHGLGPIQLNDSLHLVKQIVSHNYDVKDVEYGGFVVIEDGEELIKVHSKIGDGLIGYIEIYSSKFATSDGLHCGMKIPEIKNIRKDLRLEKDEMTGQEYFAPKELQEYPKEGDPPNTLNLIYLKSDDGEDLSERYEYNENHGFQSFGKIKDSGKISFFRIYNWH
jgi:hypothetical protein